MHAELPIASFICAALVLIPLPWHWRAGTVATTAITCWLFVANIINGVNTIIWANNLRIVIPVWCDITTKITIGSNVALPAAIFCLCVHLERVSSIRQVSTSHAEKRRRQLFDALLCFGFPLIYMAIHYTVQGHRFDIVEDFGCRPTTYVSILSTFLIWVPPLFFSMGSLILAGFAFRNFWNRRISFALHLQNSNSALTPSRYFRLMCMALVQMFLSIIVTSLNMWFTMSAGLRPWTGWADVHFNFSRIALFPALLIPEKDWEITYWLWWTIPLSSILFFSFFSFGADAMTEYRAGISWVKRNIFRRPDSVKGNTSLGSYGLRGMSQSLPTHVKVDISISKETSTTSASTFHKQANCLPLQYNSDLHFPDPAPSYHSPLDSCDSLQHDSMKDFRTL